MKCLHIMPDSIYSKEYVDRINRLYASEKHFFLIQNYQSDRQYLGKNLKVVEKINWFLMLEIIVKIFKSDRVILHSLYIDKKCHVIFALLACFLPNKFMWYIWSDDLYAAHKAEISITGLSLQKRIKTIARKVLISHLKAIVVVAEGDYIHAKEWYKTKAQMLQAEYSYNLIEKELDDKKQEDHTINILAGHSASTSLMHEAMYERLSFCKEYDVSIISILSYQFDDMEYRDKVIQLGRQSFGDKYVPIVDWMPYTKYIDLLDTVDVALFEGDVQMGAGNIFNLIYLGKRVYLSKDNSLYQFLKANQIRCFSKDELLPETVYLDLTIEDKKSNREKVEKLLSDDMFKAKWDKVFN